MRITKDDTILTPRSETGWKNINEDEAEAKCRFDVSVKEEKLRALLKDKAEFADHLLVPRGDTSGVHYKVVGNVMLTRYNTEKLRAEAETILYSRSIVKALERNFKVDLSDNPIVIRIIGFYPRANVKSRVNKLTEHKGIGRASAARILEIARSLKAEYVAMSTSRKFAQETLEKCGFDPVDYMKSTECKYYTREV